MNVGDKIQVLRIPPGGDGLHVSEILKVTQVLQTVFLAKAASGKHYGFTLNDRDRYYEVLKQEVRA